MEKTSMKIIPNGQITFPLGMTKSNSYGYFKGAMPKVCRVFKRAIPQGSGFASAHLSTTDMMINKSRTITNRRGADAISITN
jgi:hypothetical protein